MKRKIKKDEIQFENELLKLQARAEFGATVHSESDLPDEIENQFFKNVLKFERAHRQVKSVRVFDFIGKPEIKNIRSIKKNQLKNEMNRLLELFSEHNIAIDCICEVSDSDFYKFLSEELIHEEMDDFQATGWTHHYIYEEFYPNDKHDLQTLTEDFIKSILSKEFDFYKTWIHESVKTKKGKYISSQEVIGKIEAFRNSFDHFEKREISIDELQFGKKKAVVKALIFYHASFDKKQIHFNGEASLRFKKGESGYWEVSQLSMPGLII